MLVRALCLRHLGKKLSVEQLRAAVPLTGLLRMNASQYGGRDGRGREVCLLMPASGEVRPLVELFNAKLVRIEARGVLIAGEEDFWNRKQRSTYKQALWAWPAPPEKPEAPPSSSARSPEAARFIEALEELV